MSRGRRRRKRMTSVKAKVMPPADSKRDADCYMHMALQLHLSAAPDQMSDPNLLLPIGQMEIDGLDRTCSTSTTPDRCSLCIYNARRKIHLRGDTKIAYYLVPTTLLDIRLSFMRTMPKPFLYLLTSIARYSNTVRY